MFIDGFLQMKTNFWLVTHFWLYYKKIFSSFNKMFYLNTTIIRYDMTPAENMFHFAFPNIIFLNLNYFCWFVGLALFRTL